MNLSQNISTLLTGVDNRRENATCYSVHNHGNVSFTSSSVVAERPRDASCLSVVSFNNTILLL